jgi:hypothetical protein
MTSSTATKQKPEDRVRLGIRDLEIRDKDKSPYSTKHGEPVKVSFAYNGGCTERTLTVRLIALDSIFVSDMMATLDPSKPLLITTEAEAIQCLRERGYIVAVPCACQRYNGSTTPATAEALHISSYQPVYSVPGEVNRLATSHHKRSRGENWADAQAPSHPTTPIFGRHDVTVQNCDPIDELEIGYSDDDDDISSSHKGVSLSAGHLLNQEDFATSEFSIHERVSPSASTSDPIVIHSLVNRYNRAKSKQERKDVLEEFCCMGLAAEDKSRFLAGVLDGGPAAATLADRFRKTKDKEERKAIRKEVRRLNIGAIFEFALVPGKKH